MHRTLARELGVVVFKAIVVVLSLVFFFSLLGFLYEFEETVGDGVCNVAVYPIEGIILPYLGIYDAPLITTPDAVEEFFSQIESEETIKAILLEINSPGGTPVASERIAERVRNTNVPVVGLIGDQGTSGGYMIAAATDYLLASAMSNVGSIGVNMSYLEESEKLDEEGIEYVRLTTGKFKDIGSPYRPITDEERELLQADLDTVHNYFIDLVSSYRNLDRDKVAALADGASMTGSRALESELIDAVGGRMEAKESLAVLLDTSPDEVIFCEYEPPLLPW